MKLLRALLARLVMDEAAAAAEGFTHHGRMFSVPCWVTTGACPMVAPKLALLEPWIGLCTLATQFMGLFGVDAWFQIVVGAPIARGRGMNLSR